MRVDAESDKTIWLNWCSILFPSVKKAIYDRQALAGNIGTFEVQIYHIFCLELYLFIERSFCNPKERYLKKGQSWMHLVTEGFVDGERL